MQSFIYQRFLTGEVGDRLSGLANSEAYQMAVRTSRNFHITPIGSLRLCNKYLSIALAVDEDILFARDTKTNFYYAISANKIYVIRKSDRAVISQAAHGVSGIQTVNTFENFITVSNLTTIKFFVLNESTGALGTTDYLAQITKPVRWRKPLKIAFYRWYTAKEYDSVEQVYKDKKKLLKISALEDLESAGTDGTGALIISGVKSIKRLYFIASSSLTESVFNDADFADGDVIMNFEQGKIDDFYINGHNVTFTGSAIDAKGNDYSTGVSGINIAKGKATRGESITLSSSNVRDACVFQNRLALITSTEIFFSEKFDYLNFLNGIEESGAFYLKPSPINGTQPNLRSMIAGKGLWINSDKGYYALAYDTSFSSLDNYINTVSDRKPSMVSHMVDDTLYYTDTQGVLFAVRNVGEQTLKFQSIEVDKFDINRNISNVTSIIVDGVDYILAQNVGRDRIVYLYRRTQEGLYSRISMDVATSGKIIGWETDYIIGKVLYNKSESFMSGYIEVLPPGITTKEKGLYLNHNTKYIKQVTVKILNENDSAIKSMVINGTKLDKVIIDDYSVYTMITSFRIEKGFKIEVEHNGNADILEILGIEIHYS
ncbi:MAG: hypothetical protein ACRCU6_06835 [Fusobacteriaceae bacterium]